VDHAVVLFGLNVEAKLSQRTKKGKPKYQLEQLLRERLPPKDAATHARSARQMVRRTVRVREDGTW
jgi:hypothetical protein